MSEFTDSSDRMNLPLSNVTRRDFLKYCSALVAIMGIPGLTAAKLVKTIEKAAQRTPVIWLHFASCTGCTESFIQGFHPSPAEIILDILSVDYQETIMAGGGKQAEELRYQTMEKYKGKYITIVEGAVPLGDNGNYLRIGGKTAVEIAKEVCRDAAAVINVGSCSFDGGWVAAKPNPTGATGTQQATGISKKKFINLPCCPVHPDWLAATVVNYLLLGRIPELDSRGRPKFLYGQRIHDLCERRAHFDAGEFVEAFGSAEARKQFCLYKMGCKGPETYASCSITRWNNKNNWCIGAGSPCIGCAQPNWADAGSPFFSRLPGIKIPGMRGVEYTVDRVGFTLLGATAAGLAAHAIYTSKKHRNEEEKKPVEVEEEN
ncbi:MAG: hydrogenase small subunit [Fidelibacterota bacterium]